jgi:hypothetical protein
MKGKTPAPRHTTPQVRSAVKLNSHKPSPEPRAEAPRTAARQCDTNCGMIGRALADDQQAQIDDLTAKLADAEDAEDADEGNGDPDDFFD